MTAGAHTFLKAIDGGLLSRMPRPCSWGQAPAGAQTPEQRDKWLEVDLNWHMRAALRLQGLLAIHIREANETGIADLVVYGPGVMDQIIHGWIELKITDELGSIRPAQRQFMRDHWDLAHNAIFCMRHRRMDMLVLRQGNLKGRVMMVDGDPYNVNWEATLNKFRVRR